MQRCFQCGEEKSNLGNHWRLSLSCEYPSFNWKQLSVLTGILMGDGTLDRSGANCRIKVEMINKEYLNYVDSILENLSTGVSLSKTAEKNAELMRDSGFRPNANKEDYSDVYKLTTRRHPSMNDFSPWYDSGKKAIPKFELTPTIVKHWYVCDGHLAKRDDNRPAVIFGISNEYENSEKLEQMFIEQGIDARTNKSKNLRIGADHTEKFFRFIGGPIDGFKYKWP